VTPSKAVGAGGIYEVKPNDSLFVIAAREKVSAAALAAANGLQLNAVLRVGQKLKIPAPGSNPKTLAPKSSSSGKAESANTGATDNGPAFTPIKLIPLSGTAVPADGATATPAPTK
jgi:LysM repeat protein